MLNGDGRAVLKDVPRRSLKDEAGRSDDHLPGYVSQDIFAMDV